ncbi:reverse transcriptase domain-containing protein [Tanacetum coccineum]
MKVRENDKPSAQRSRFLKMFQQLRLEIRLKDALVEMPKFNKWLSSLLRNKEKLEEIAITTVNAECSAIIMNKVPEKLEDPGKFLIPCALQELNRTSALADSGASINLLPHSIYKKLELEALTPTRMTLELANRSITHPMGIAEDVVVRVDGFTFLADFVVVNFEPDPRVPIILGRPFLRTAKALIDLYEETLTLRVGKEELVYYADKSEKNKDKNFVHAISVIDFSKADPFSGSTTNILPPSSSPMKTSDNFEKFADELAPLDSLPPGNDDSTLKKDLHEENFQVYSNPLFEFDDNFKSSNVNPLFEENDKDVEIKSSFTLTSPEGKFSSSNPTSPTLTGEKVCSWNTPMFFSLVRFVWKMMKRNAIRKKIICLLATYLHQKPKPLSRPQEVEEIKEKEDEVSSDVPINTIVMPIRITFDNPIDFNDHFSKPKDLKKDLTISLDSTKSSILPPPLLDSDSPFTAELSASITLNSLGNEDKVFKPGILVYHAIHDKNLVTLEENSKENISSGTLLFLKEPSSPRLPPEPPDECLNFEPILVMKNVVLNEDFYQSKKTLPLNVEDVNSFAFVIWTFLPYFTYPEDSPLIFSFRSENFVFDPGIVTFHKPCSFRGCGLGGFGRGELSSDCVGGWEGSLCFWVDLATCGGCCKVEELAECARGLRCSKWEGGGCTSVMGSGVGDNGAGVVGPLVVMDGSAKVVYRFLKSVALKRKLGGNLMKDQHLPADTLPIALSPDYISDSDPKEDDEEDPEEDPADYPADGGDNDDNESSDDDNDDDDVRG